MFPIVNNFCQLLTQLLKIHIQRSFVINCNDWSPLIACYASPLLGALEILGERRVQGSAMMVSEPKTWRI